MTSFGGVSRVSGCAGATSGYLTRAAARGMLEITGLASLAPSVGLANPGALSRSRRRSDAGKSGGSSSERIRRLWLDTPANSGALRGTKLGRPRCAPYIWAVFADAATVRVRLGPPHTAGDDEYPCPAPFRRSGWRPGRMFGGSWGLSARRNVCTTFCPCTPEWHWWLISALAIRTRNDTPELQRVGWNGGNLRVFLLLER